MILSSNKCKQIVSQELLVYQLNLFICSIDPHRHRMFEKNMNWKK